MAHQATGTLVKLHRAHVFPLPPVVQHQLACLRAPGEALHVELSWRFLAGADAKLALLAREWEELGRTWGGTGDDAEGSWSVPEEGGGRLVGGGSSWDLGAVADVAGAHVDVIGWKEGSLEEAKVVIKVGGRASGRACLGEVFLDVVKGCL